MTVDIKVTSPCSHLTKVVVFRPCPKRLSIHFTTPGSGGGLIFFFRISNNLKSTYPNVPCLRAWKAHTVDKPIHAPVHQVRPLSPQCNNIIATLLPFHTLIGLRNRYLGSYEICTHRFNLASKHKTSKRNTGHSKGRPSAIACLTDNVNKGNSRLVSWEACHRKYGSDLHLKCKMAEENALLGIIWPGGLISGTAVGITSHGLRNDRTSTEWNF